MTGKPTFCISISTPTELAEVFSTFVRLCAFSESGPDGSVIAELGTDGTLLLRLEITCRLSKQLLSNLYLEAMLNAKRSTSCEPEPSDEGDIHNGQ